MRVLLKKMLYESPGKGVLVYGDTFYPRPDGMELIAYRSIETKSDLIDSMEERRSPDNGRTWSAPQDVPVVAEAEEGMLRRHLMPGWVDPGSGRLLQFLTEGVLPNDDVVEDGMRRYYLRYRVSDDGGRSWAVDEQARQNGPAETYTKTTPFDGVTVGRNSMMLGDKGSMPLRTQAGTILVPVQVCPVGPDGDYYNPGGGHTYHDAAVLRGTWTSDGRLKWDLSDYVKADPARSTRGAIEPTLAQMPDGRILMVLRGSNGGKKDPNCRLPGYRWYTVSNDDGRTWAPVEPWTYADGTAFYSPSSMSQLVGHSNRTLYWLGNICESNPCANSPRYPLYIGTVNPETLLLEKESLCMVDTREPNEPEGMTLSNFFAREDRETGDIVLHMSRWFLPEWIGNAYIYRIEP